MTIRRSLAQRTAVLTVTAAADPPALNVDPCEQTLLLAAAWPGTSSDGVRFVSDAYDYYLSQQAACTPGT